MLNTLSKYLTREALCSALSISQRTICRFAQRRLSVPFNRRRLATLSALQALRRRSVIANARARKQSMRTDKNMNQAKITLAKLLDTLSACQASQNSTEYDEHCRTLAALKATYSRQCAEEERSATETDFTNNNKKHTKGNPKK